MSDSVRFALTEQDMADAARLYGVDAIRSPRRRIGLVITFVLVVVLMAMVLDIAFPLDPERLASRWPALLGLSLLPFAVVLALGVVLNPLLARRTYRQQRSLQGELGLSWSRDQLAFDSEYGQFAMPWSHFKRWTEDKRVFLLFESERLYRIIPKRALDADQQDRFRDCLAAIGT
ncbi:YcxB family protein [Devosia sp. 63-57]|uniref:YcxB family protein n=1 Tax=Devosia sp. 63-57 TaxID=1895751 RepID=UPI00086B60FF|nr:YcxB family protein [Devosia sp. 63-57]ODT51202.1 MAG: hypothetical protein ABS74_00515 [Pelagibacterium sp. SCN 63-126]ODU84157.1 MAG: hypothetical protein ABT14_15000 [Pelagibacterium sp. SCN 63-17]OJX41666.1 MAG: hypothetical protein BGO80_08650 [Devosia sp. 63-57]